MLTRGWLSSPFNEIKKEMLKISILALNRKVGVGGMNACYVVTPHELRKQKANKTYG